MKKYRDKEPAVHPSAFIAEGVDIIGDFSIGECSSLWFGTVARADVNKIVIGKFTNIQDGCIIHCSGEWPTFVGDYVTVGHRAILHGCLIGNNCLIGMGAIIMDGAEIGDNVIVGAGALVTQGKKIPSNSLVLGYPAKIIREVTKEEVEYIRESALHYAEIAREYKIDGPDC